MKDLDNCIIFSMGVRKTNIKGKKKDQRYKNIYLKK